MVPKKIITILLSVFLPLCVSAQEEWTIQRGDCLPTGLPKHSYANTTRLAGPRRLPAIYNEWDATKTYHQLVVLLEFSDLQFSIENPQEFYNSILNEPGYNSGSGPGCAAEYFRTQSNGLFNLQFDVYGPYAVSQKAVPYDEPTASTRNYGGNSFREATQKLVEEHPDIDFSQYDWNNDGEVNQVIFVYAGYGGNNGSKTYGHIWPNTASFSSIPTPDGKILFNYSASAELWPTNMLRSCGIGTICHEFTHSLGLPDIYPTNGWCVSVCDEWDLMDGGNFTNYGWCPPNYTPIEKMLLGWLTPIELTEPASIVNLKPVSEGGEVYIADYTPIPTDDEEQPSEARAYDEGKACVLIENRQQTQWDAGTPGSGLMVWYLDYDASAWRNNTPNNRSGNPRFCPIYADGMDYDAWKAKLAEEGTTNPYQNKNRMNSWILSTSPYPFGEKNAVEECQISNITIDDMGNASFDFMGGDPSAIRTVSSTTSSSASVRYDLSGRQVTVPAKGQMYIVRQADGMTKIVIEK